MKEVKLICVECPNGCEITVKMQGDTILEVLNNACPRGIGYARNEVVCPKRVVTSTVKTTNGKFLSVKTDSPIDKSKILDIMKVINQIEVAPPIEIGDVIMKDIQPGVNLVASDNSWWDFMINDYFGKDFTKLGKKKLFLFDMDGTIYMEGRLFDGVTTLLKKIVEKGAKYVFVTNNSSKSVADYIKKLSDMGIDCDESNFYTSTQASCQLVKSRLSKKLIYAQGTDSFLKELKDNGIKVTTRFEEGIGAILVAFDIELTGEKLRTTSEVLTKLDVPYYATNPDWVCPVEFGYIPDCGSMCFGYEKATGKSPIYIGKPNPMMINLAMEKFGCTKQETVVIGDRIYTDIASGYNAGVETVLVLSGETTIKDYQESEIKPTYVLDGVQELLKCL